MVDVQISSEPVTGEATGGTAFGIFTFGATDYAEAMTYDGSGFRLVSDLLGASRLDKIKRAAIRDACAESKCQVLAYPTFRWKKEWKLFATEYTVQVSGYPGFIREIRNVPRQVSPGLLRLGPDDDPVPPANRYRIEGGEAAAIQVQMAQSSEGAVPEHRTVALDRPFGWRG
ncbi:MAG: hypothetical protein D6702_06800 [Planctomycetota bacterium]|nr:MAG: hypothetical protein D6702_06800 [Planctomycetota bacterium]